MATAAKQAAEDRARAATEAKAKAEAPLTSDEKRDTMSALASSDSEDKKIAGGANAALLKWC